MLKEKGQKWHVLLIRQRCKNVLELFVVTFAVVRWDFNLHHNWFCARSFYLLDSYPGRWFDGPSWVEAPINMTALDGSPFRNLNDGVTPVVITGNDFAAAWAMGDDGRPLYPVGSGLAGERQREIARRVGVNLLMYVMTGNYKSDQVHIPALLERLGQ